MPTATPIPGEWRAAKSTLPSLGGGFPDYFPPAQAPPAPEVKDRLVFKESHLSLLVKDVSQTLEAIQARTVELGGYLVESNLTNPQEAGQGDITVRVPQEKLGEALNFFRTLAVKVVSENLRGQDVTDEYVDIEARLTPLLKNKARFEEIMAREEKIEDILRIQQEIINLQNQIDSLRGQQNYLRQTAKMAKLTIFLSTDELILPYAPSQPWRPEAIFKQAVRSLLTNLQRTGTVAIWLGVYVAIWLPIAAAIFLLRRRKIPKS